MAVRVLVASDAPVYCEGFERLFREFEQIEFVGAATCAAEAADCVRHIGPDIVLLDMSMEEAFSAARKVAKTSRSSRIVALGMPESESEVIRCAEVGIAGYVTRGGSVSDVVAAIDAVSRGEVRISPRIAGSLFRRVGALASRRRATASPLARPDDARGAGAADDAGGTLQQGDFASARHRTVDGKESCPQHPRQARRAPSCRGRVLRR